MGALNSAGQRKRGIEASWLSSVLACLRAGRIVFRKSYCRLSHVKSIHLDATRQFDKKISEAPSELAGVLRLSESWLVRVIEALPRNGRRGVCCFSGVFCSDHPLQ
jgi:hypothetical protein